MAARILFASFWKMLPSTSATTIVKHRHGTAMTGILGAILGSFTEDLNGINDTHKVVFQMLACISF